jgi:hypothetical protein
MQAARLDRAVTAKHRHIVFSQRQGPALPQLIVDLLNLQGIPAPRFELHPHALPLPFSKHLREAPGAAGLGRGELLGLQEAVRDLRLAVGGAVHQAPRSSSHAGGDQRSCQEGVRVRRESPLPHRRG